MLPIPRNSTGKKGFKHKTEEEYNEDLQRREENRIGREKRKEESELMKQKYQENRERQREWKAQWPPLKKDYLPELWSVHYSCYSDFAPSIPIFQDIEKIEDKEEAGKKMMEMLQKVSFVEASLTTDGRQNLEELWENLNKSVTEEQEFPFSSVEDLSTFLHSMIPIFRRDVRTKKWANTGCQFRRFCQWLYDRLSLGDIIDEENFDDDYDEFKTTIKFQKPEKQEDVNRLREFAEKEALLDFSSYEFLAATVPGFQFDETTGILSLTPEASSRLPLRLPIFLNTINSFNPFKVDYSREINCCVSSFPVAGSNKKNGGLILGGPLDGTRTVLYSKRMEPKNPNNEKQYLNAHGYIAPNNPMSQVELFQTEASRLDFQTEDLALRGVYLEPTTAQLEKKDWSFGGLNGIVNNMKGRVSSRPKVDYEEEIREKNEKKKKMEEEEAGRGTGTENRGRGRGRR